MSEKNGCKDLEISLLFETEEGSTVLPKIIKVSL